MSHLSQGLLSNYNSLTDKHLTGYFSNTRIRRHLQRAGLITRSGRIVSDKEYKHKLIKKTHQRHISEGLAQAIFHRVLEMERLHQAAIKRKLEEFARRERVQKMKMGRSRRYDEDITRVLSPRPPTGARDHGKPHSGPEEEHSESSESPGSSQPNTAPGKMQRPVRLKPIHSASASASLKHSSPYRLHEPPPENDLLFNQTMDRKSCRHLTTLEAHHGTSPYLPVINNYVAPVPPVTKRKEGGLKVTPSGTIRGRRLHPTTAPSGTDEPPWLRSSIHQTKVHVNMVYFGKTVHLSNDLIDTSDEVRVFQQHCGGENLCVFRGYLQEGETFQFISRRHRGFPFSLTFYLNGLQVERLSSCCEFKHKKSSRLGGRHGHFGFSSVEGAAPCYRCILAMGLDTKPIPPPKRKKEVSAQEQSADSPVDAPEMGTARTQEDAACRSESDTSPTRDPETRNKEQTAPVGAKGRDDYEEDFEADDEGPVEEATVKGTSPSPFNHTEKKEEKEASETDDDITSHSGSSSSGSDQEESDSEGIKDEKKDVPEEDQEEAASPTDETEEPQTQVPAATKEETVLDSAGDSTEIEISETSVPSGSEDKQNNRNSEDKTHEDTGDGNKEEDEQERAKSVQEKLAEAILKESQCSSEPELSDTSTEEEEGSADKDSTPGKKEEVQTVVEEPRHEESVTEEVEEKQKDLSKTTKEEGDEEQEPLDSCENIKEEKVEEVEEDEKAGVDGDESEEAGGAQLHVDEGNVAQEEKTTDPIDRGESPDAVASENDERKTDQEGDVQPGEVDERTKSREESSVLELSKETDETDNPEETAASETVEIKAESSEELEALSCEEPPEADTERLQQPDSEDTSPASETEVTEENPSSSAADPTGEHTAEETVEDETTTEANDQTSEADERNNDSEPEKREEEEHVETAMKENEKMSNDGEEEEKKPHLNSDDITEDENTQEGENDQTEEIGDENKVDDSITAEITEVEAGGEENEEEAVKPQNEVNNIEEQEETENDENHERAENQSIKEEPEAEVDVKSQVDEKRNVSDMASEEKDDEAGKPGEVETENKESDNNKEGEETTDVIEDTAGGGKTSEIKEEPEKREAPDMAEETTKIDSETVAESEEAADGTETPKTAEDENINEGTAETSEKGEVDAENGEISFVDEGKSNDEEEEEAAPGGDQTKSEPVKQSEEEIKTNVATEDENAEVRVESEGSPTQQKDDAKEGDNSLEKHNESANKDSEPETSGPEMKEDLRQEEGRDNDETGEDENDIKSDTDDKIKELDLTEDDTNIKDNVSERALLADEYNSAPVDDVDGQLDKGEVEPEREKLPESGENGDDREEASKVSEEGASVLLKPQTQNEEADDGGQTVSVRTDIPEALADEDSTDMVTNWIKMHQSSKYFETFVEPLDDLREEDSDLKESGTDEETPSTELAGSESPLKMKEDETEPEDKTPTETEETRGEDDQNNEQTNDALLEKETNEVKTSLQGEEMDNGTEEQDGPEKESQSNMFTKVESLLGDVTAGSVFEDESGENVSDFNVKQADVSLKTRF
ncbi:glutamate-rich protein 3 [Nothobranchius furzeri]|uniref:Chromosome 1 open reading frame 173 n=3 Tax=Nothobranchius furzeri TaxID=105023 RepID=A0A1A7ZU23_NOTFU|nr:glutamate rich 3 [Nothobranchius furzeri]